MALDVITSVLGKNELTFQKDTDNLEMAIVRCCGILYYISYDSNYTTGGIQFIKVQLP